MLHRADAAAAAAMVWWKCDLLFDFIALLRWVGLFQSIRSYTPKGTDVASMVPLL